MSWRVEENGENRDVVIDGWELGIAPSPHGGIADMRNVNLLSSPGEVAVNFAPTALTAPATVDELAFTVDTSTDVFTVASTTGWYNGMAIELDTIVTSTGISTGTVYWIESLTSTTFKLNVNASRSAGGTVNVTGSNGSGTMSSYVLGKPIDKATARNSNSTSGRELDHYQFFLDDNGLAWWVDSTGGTETSNLVYLGNTTLTSAGTGRAIAVMLGYLIVFRSATMDALILQAIEDVGGFTNTFTNWDIGWENISGASREPRAVLVGQDNVMYYDNSDNTLGSISQNSGSTFDPATGSTYTENIAALDIPVDKRILSLAELGVALLIGSDSKEIYPWDRTSSSFNIPITVAEEPINEMLSTGLEAYIFAGERGRIYETNGSSVSLFYKVPDHITGKFEPYFSIDAVELNRDQLYFSFTPTENDGTAISGLSGIWAIDINTSILRHVNQPSAGTGATVNVIAPNPHSSYKPSGSGLYLGTDNSGSYAIDKTSSSPYVSGETIIDTDIIPIGTDKFPETISQIEFKLAKPLVSGESVELQQRSDLNESFTSISSSNTVGLIADSYDPNFENVEWLQIRAILTSTATTPSFVPLREIRIRL